MSTPLRERLEHFAAVPLRLMLGVGFIYHGYPKVFTGPGNDSFTGMLAGIGVPAPGLNSYLIGSFEFFGGLLLILGIAVRTVSALGIVEMIVAALTVHGSSGFNAINITGTGPEGALQFGMPGFEINLLYIAGFASLLLLGEGRLSLPSISERKLDRDVRERHGASEHEREPTRVG